MTHILVPTETFLDEHRIPIYGVLTSYIQKLTSYDLLPLFVTPLINEKLLMTCIVLPMASILWAAVILIPSTTVKKTPGHYRKDK